MKEKELINKLDLEKLQNKKQQLKPIKIKYTAITTIFAILLALSIMFFIGNTFNDKNGTIIGLVLSILFSIPTYIFNKKLKNIMYEINEINYYINKIEINLCNKKYKENMINSYGKIENISIDNNSKYHIKATTITENEKYFLEIIKKHFGKDYDIRPQVPLSSIIEKEKDFENQYQNELYRVIDIGIFNKETTTPLLLIEINDNTHKRKDRQIRDAKLKNICDQANIKLITFWTEYQNTEEYIFNRVNENLGR